MVGGCVVEGSKSTNVRMPISRKILAKYTHNVLWMETICMGTNEKLPSREISQFTIEDREIRKTSQASKGIIFYGRQSFPFHDM